MSRDEARQHIKAAQEAEIAGNREGAVRHLERAALAYLRVGQHGRAAQMYKNCLRLAPERQDLKEALEKAERWAAQRSGSSELPLAQRLELPSDELPEPSQTFDALAIPRGPQRMPEGLEAWCSFCCRPTTEVGELVAGPAGAFICAACVSTSAGMLGTVAAAPSAPAPAVPRPPSRPVAVAPPPREVSWLGPEPVLLAAQAALTGRALPLVVVGGEGAGKSALLDALLDDRPELPRIDLALGEAPPERGPVLVEHLELASPATRAALRRCAFVATWRAEVEPAPLAVRLGEAAHVFPVAQGLGLPPELPPALVLALAAPGQELLERLLDRELDQAGPRLSEEVRAALVKRALAAGRGAKGLLAELAMLRSLPSGAPLELAEKPRRTRKKRE